MHKRLILTMLLTVLLVGGNVMAQVTVGGNVYGGGNAADVGVNATVNITSSTAWVKGSVYGGGNLGSVGTFDVIETAKPTTCTDGTGTCTVTISGGTIGPETLSMPNFTGHVFGASKGEVKSKTDDANIDYKTFVNTTSVTISGTAFIKGSVYGGSENGHVLDDTEVTINGGQIGCGAGKSAAYTAEQWESANASDFTECPHWTYGEATADADKYAPYDKFAEADDYDSRGGRTTGDDGHTFYGNVFGGGSGYFPYAPGEWLREAGAVYGSTKVTINGGHILTSVYGGNELTDVQGDACVVEMKGGTLGVPRTLDAILAHPVTCYLFGAGKGDQRTFFNQWTNVKNVQVTVSGTARIFGSVFGGGEDGHVLGNVEITIEDEVTTTGEGPEAVTTRTSPIIGTLGTSYVDGNVFGGGRGFGGDALTAGVVCGNVNIDIAGGTMLGSIYGGGRLGSVGTYLAKPDDTTYYGELIPDGKKMVIDYVTGNVSIADDAATHGHITINVSGGTIGNTAEYVYPTAAQKTGALRNTTFGGGDKLVATKGGNIFTGCMGRLYGLDGSTLLPHWANLGKAKITTLNITGGTIKSSVYGGSELGKVAETATVSITGGTIGTEVASGGEGKPAYYFGSVFGGGKGSIDAITYPTGTAEADKTPISEAGTVGGDVLVELNNGVGHTQKGGIVRQIFGCNDLNGSPKSNVTVHVYATQNAAATQIANTPAVAASGDNPAVEAVKNAKVTGRYDVVAVYGGGNEAVYNPTTPSNGSSGSKTHVIIEGCEETSIETVYGGGNAAAVPETNVEIKSAYEIYQVFGGGNGKDKKGDGSDNPGADVGTPDHGTSTYGTGNANTKLEGGHIHEVYGGSNQKGIIKGSINQMSDPGVTCDLAVEKIVGAGKYADIDGDVNMTLGCQPNNKVDVLFAGADEANVNGNITLNITNGHFGQVFGGNNLGGAIKGKITVNVEETGCQPIRIDELYLGSNEAAYSIYGYYESDEVHEVTHNKILKPRASATDDHTPVSNPATDATHTFPYAHPELNIISCTYIGKVFGGSYGAGADMYANPTVNINMIPGDHANSMTTNATYNPNKLGEIGDVFGGGNAANVYGNTTVNICTAAKVQMTSIKDGEGNLLATQPEYDVKGAYITGNVYGGGNNADVTGNATVTVSGDNPDALASVTRKAVILGSIYGGGNLGSVGDFTRDTSGSGHSHATGVTCLGGKPNGLATTGTGTCTVTVNGWTEIGPNDMQMTKSGGPDDTGYIFGASRGEVIDPEEDPDIDFRTYVNETDVTVGGHAFIKGSVYGGSENGRVLNDTYVKIQDNCQIGNGHILTYKDVSGTKTIDKDYSLNRRYTSEEWAQGKLLGNSDWTSESLPECASWPYENPYKPYDKHGTAHDGAVNATDGHTFYGNVFGGGSGLFAYEKEGGDGDWLRTAGRVEGNTNVEITGGHILTSVYGGCELTDVGNGLEVENGKGRCFVKMSGGTLGVPRTLEQIAAHPVTCYLFGAGKGDQRLRFNQWTNVGSVIVEINDSISQPIIYGSVFGGGEDGHVLGNTNVHIKKMNGQDPIIGTWGTSYVDGNVFGGGRGFGGDALTAGVVSGNVGIKIEGGQMLGSIYGGGRLGSVGTYLVPSTHDYYGQLIPDGEKVTIDDINGTVTTESSGGGNHGHITINISGGTIGNDHEYLYVAPSDNATLATLKTTYHIPNTDFEDYTASDGTVYKRLKHTKGGNVFAGAMGRLAGLAAGTYLDHWPDLGKAKKTSLTISGNAVIKSNVYGGGELGIVENDTEISITGGTIGTVITNEENNVDVPKYTFGSVFGGGAGSDEHRNGILTDNTKTTTTNVNTDDYAALVKGCTKIDMSGGTVRASVYGGGELAQVQGSHTKTTGKDLNIGADIEISGTTGTTTTIGYNQEGFGGATMGNVYGGGKGSLDTPQAGLIKTNTRVKVKGTPTICHNIYGGGAYGSVGTFTFNPSGAPTNWTANTGKTDLIIESGTIGINGHDNGMVFGSSRGDVSTPVAPAVGEDPVDPNDQLAWVHDTHVVIGTSSGEPSIRGSVYGSGENGHVFNNTLVDIHNGTIGIDDSSVSGYAITSNGTTYNGAEYPSRGNVYGGGCGTDTYTNSGKKLYNPMAGIVLGNTTITIDGGHVVRSVYGGGSMGSVGTFTNADATYVASHTEVPLGKPISCAENTGLCTVTISGGKIGPTTMAMPHSYGNVFGAGKGEARDTTVYTNLNISGYFNKTEVTIKDNAFVKGSVYGGSESGHVLGDTWVKIQGGQIGCGNGKTIAYTSAEWTTAKPEDFATCPSWTYAEDGYAYDMYAQTDGSYPTGSAITSSEGGRTTATDGHTFYGNVFGGGSGYTPYAAGRWIRSAGRVEGNTQVDITGGHILTSVYGANECTDVWGSSTVNMSGGTVGVPRTRANILANPALGYVFGAGKGDKRVLFNTWTNVESTSVNITGGAIYGSVYGGGEDGHVLGNAVTTIEEASGKTLVIGCDGTSGYDGNVFGGGQGSTSALTAGVVGGNVNLYIKKGSILGSVYGGGRLAAVGTHFTNPETTGYGELWTTDTDNHGNIAVSLTGGTIEQDVFGGGMGTTDDTHNTADGLGISRNVIVELNKDFTSSSTAKGCVVKGRIFGCNNMNTSPKGTVTVHVYATQKADGSKVTDKATKAATAEAGTYDVAAVYGGGNMAAYEPTKAVSGTDAEKETAYPEVIIDGCDLTSIGTVYGGGNAASVPATNVTVNGTYEIGYVFGGGNGKDDLPNGDPNPGANVGFYTYPDGTNYDTRNASPYIYGSGKAHATIYGGTVHEVYGGSNTKGNIRVEARATLQDAEGCSFNVGEAYGGGRNAPMDGNAVLDIECISGLGKAYGGAAEADVNGDVILNITNGTYGQVFGGNDLSGAIRGSITVNIEETGCRPVIIGELYAGGNEAAYSVYGYDSAGNPLKQGDSGASGTPVTSPQLNVKSFTSIGTIYGGGYGAGATMVGNPTVNINVVEGKYANTDSGRNKSIVEDNARVVGSRVEYSGTGYPVPSHEKGKIGAINNVFGGGNAAAVIGNPTVNIGTEAGEEVYTEIAVAANADVKGYYTRSGEGTTASPYTYTEITTTTTAVTDTTYYLKTVKGVDIRGNVYGGGNEATVTGNTNVVIGKDGNPTP